MHGRGRCRSLEESYKQARPASDQGNEDDFCTMKRSASNLCKTCQLARQASARQISSRRTATTATVPATFYDQLLASTAAREIHPLKTIDLLETAVQHGRAAPELVEPGGGVFNALVRAFVTQGQYESVVRLIEGSNARELVDQLELVAPIADHYIDGLIFRHGQRKMRQSRRGDVAGMTERQMQTPDLIKAVRFVQRLSAKDLLGHVSASVLSRLIQKLHEAKQTQHAVPLAQLCLAHSVELDVKSWSVLLHHQSLQIDAAQSTLAIFDDMCAAGVDPDEQAVGLVVNALKTSSDHTDRALTILSEARDAGRWNKRLATAELSLLKRQKRYADVLEGFVRSFGSDVLRELGHYKGSEAVQGSWQPDAFAMSLLVDTLVRSHPEAEKLRELYIAYTHLIDARPEYDADRYTLSVFVAAFARHRELMTQAMELLESMHRRSLTPSVVTYTSVIDGLTMHGALRLASRVLVAMQERTIKPDARTFERLITAHLRRGESDEAEIWVKAMRQLELRPSQKLLAIIQSFGARAAETSHEAASP